MDLVGEHRFHAGDDPVFSEPDFDDSGWSSVRVPGSWRGIGIDADGLVRWYRIHFEMPPGTPPADLALDLGVVGWADETFLNGHRIGGTGSLDRLPGITNSQRLYSLPEDLVRPGANVLAVRTRGWPLGANGLLSDLIGIGRQGPLARAHSQGVTRTVTAEAFLLGFAFFSWLLLAFLPKRGRVGRATIYLWLCVTAWAIHLWLFSLASHRSGLTLAPSWAFAVMHVGVCAMYAFVGTFNRERMPRYLFALMAFLVGVGLLGLVLTDVPTPLLLVSLVGMTLGDLVIVALLAGEVRARTPGAIPLLVGVTVGTAAYVATVVLSQPFVFDVLLVYHGVFFLAACQLLALARLVQAMNERARSASEYALAAHTSERTRLARDLHDGLGQMLALLKMQLQRAGRKLGSDGTLSSLDDEVAQADATMEELRRIARDLRPTPLRGRKFGEAVREYASSVARRTGLEMRVDGDFDEQVPPRVVDELYRIVQECLTNCLKHADAGRVVVELRDGETRYSLAVTDDGRGLQADANAPGLGLKTIRERSELLGGSCVLSTPPGGGTRVEVCIPK